MVKKSYNPFLMWGAWVGMAIFILLDVIRVNLEVLNTNEILVEIISSLFFPIKFNYNILVNFNPIFNIVLMMFYGFLVGWGIHSLVRSLRK